MSVFFHLTIRRRILVASSVLAIITALTGGWSFVALSSANSALAFVSREGLPVLGILLNLEEGLQDALLLERGLLFTSSSNPAAAAQKKAHDNAIDLVREALSQYAEIPAIEEENLLRADFAAAFQAWSSTSDEVLTILAEDTAQARRDAVDLSTNAGTAKFEKAESILHALRERRLAHGMTSASTQESQIARARWALLCVVVAALLLAPALSLLAARAVSRPLSETVQAFRDIAQGDGDLTRRLPVGKDETGDLAFWFNQFMDRLRRIVQAIQDGTGVLGEASSGLNAISTRMSSNAKETSGQAVGLSSAAEQVSRDVDSLVSSSRQMESCIEEIAKNAAESAKVADNAVEVTDSTQQSMMQLEECNLEITGIVNVISAIAKKSHFLALNATIEASRAGEAGRGFAVVAQEVKDLAKSTAEATESIGTKITAIQSSIANATSSIARLAEIIARVSECSVTIARSVDEQTATTQEIGKTVGDMCGTARSISTLLAEVLRTSKTTTVCAGEAQESAQRLVTVSDDLDGLVGKFRL